MCARTVGSDGGRRRRGARGWAAAVVAAGLMVSGCSGAEEEPAAEAPEPVASTAVPTTEVPAEPTSEPTELYGQPVTAPGVDPEGARQAAVEFMEAVGEAIKTSDSSVLRSLSEDTCSYCSTQIAENDRRSRQDRHAADNFTLTIHSAEGFAPVAGNEFHSALVDVETQPFGYIDRSGEVVAPMPGSRLVLLVGLRKIESGWTVVQAMEVTDADAARLRSERS